MALLSSDPKCVISRLIAEGNYDIILLQIFSYLDKISLISCGKVCKLWRTVISNVMRSFPKHFSFLNIQVNTRWKSNSITTFRSRNLKELLGKLSDKICQSYFDANRQLLILGRSFSGVGKKLVLTSSEFSNTILLSNNEDISSALLHSNYIIASFTTGNIKIWQLQEGSSKVGDYKLFRLGEAGLQMKLVSDNLYIVTKNGGILVFNVVFGKITKQIPPPDGSRIQIFDIDTGLMAAGTNRKQILIWSLAENKIVHKLRAGGHVPMCLILSRPLLVCGGGDTCINVWHVRQAVILYKLSTSQAWISCAVLRHGVIVAGDVRGQVMKWDLGTHDMNNHGEVEPDIIAQMSDAVRGLYLDQFSLTSLSFDASCLVWDFW